MKRLTIYKERLYHPEDSCSIYYNRLCSWHLPWGDNEMCYSRLNERNTSHMQHLRNALLTESVHLLNWYVDKVLLIQHNACSVICVCSGLYSCAVDWMEFTFKITWQAEKPASFYCQFFSLWKWSRTKMKVEQSAYSAVTLKACHINVIDSISNIIHHISVYSYALFSCMIFLVLWIYSFEC